jgi:hypothetical protein
MLTFRMTAGSRWRRLAGGRVLACASALSLGLAWCWTGAVSAQIEQSSFALGERLADELGDVVSEPQAILVNGQTAWIASKTTPLSVSEALDRFDAHCVATSQSLRTNLDGLEAEASASGEEGTALSGQRWLIRRGEVPGQGGQLVCLAPTQPLEGFLDLGERLGTLFETGELTALGELRYVRAKPRPEGGTHVITVWTAGDFNLFEALPRDADVPGTEPDRVPRPPDAMRTLSARIPGRDYAMYSYISKRSAAELLQFYASEMPKQGWALLDAERFVPETAALSTMARVYHRGDAITFVVVDDTGEPAPARATATLVQAKALRAVQQVAPPQATN